MFWIEKHGSKNETIFESAISTDSVKTTNHVFLVLFKACRNNQYVKILKKYQWLRKRLWITSVCCKLSSYWINLAYHRKSPMPQFICRYANHSEMTRATIIFSVEDLRWSFFCENSRRLQVINYICKNALC